MSYHSLKEINKLDYGGTSGNAHAFTTSDIDQLFSVSGRKLNLQNVDTQGRFCVIGPSQLQILQDVLSTRNTGLGDKVGQTGMVGNRFGFDIFVSNNLTFTARWTPTDRPANGEKIYIAGLTITFTTSTPAAVGEVYSETDTATTLDNLIRLLNNTGAVAASTVDGSSKYYNFSQASLARLAGGMTATDGTTYVDIAMVGGGEVEVGHSAGTNDTAEGAWSKQTLHCLAGRRGATSMVLQQAPGLRVVPDPDQLGDTLQVWQLYGVKTFTGEDKYNLVDVNVALSTITSSSAT